MGLFSKLFGGSKNNSSQQAQNKAQPRTPSSPEEAIRFYIEDNIPAEYPKAPCYKCEVTVVEKEHFGVRLVLNLNSEGMKESEALELTELETGYLMENVFNQPPYPTDFTLVFYVGGSEFATVVKPHNVKIHIRVHNGITDQF